MKSPNPYVILLMQQALKKQGIIVIFLFLFTNSIGARQHFHGCVFPDLLGIWLWICKCVGVPWVPYFYFDPNLFFFKQSHTTQYFSDKFCSRSASEKKELACNYSGVFCHYGATLLFCLFFYSLCFLYSTGPLYPRGGKSNCVVTGSCTHNRRYCIHF